MPHFIYPLAKRLQEKEVLLVKRWTQGINGANRLKDKMHSRRSFSDGEVTRATSLTQPVKKCAARSARNFVCLFVFCRNLRSDNVKYRYLVFSQRRFTRVKLLIAFLSSSKTIWKRKQYFWVLWLKKNFVFRYFLPCVLTVTFVFWQFCYYSPLISSTAPSV